MDADLGYSPGTEFAFSCRFLEFMQSRSFQVNSDISIIITIHSQSLTRERLKDLSKATK